MHFRTSRFTLRDFREDDRAEYAFLGELAGHLAAQEVPEGSVDVELGGLARIVGDEPEVEGISVQRRGRRPSRGST